MLAMVTSYNQLHSRLKIAVFAYYEKPLNKPLNIKLFVEHFLLASTPPRVLALNESEKSLSLNIVLGEREMGGGGYPIHIEIDL